MIHTFQSIRGLHGHIWSSSSLSAGAMIPSTNELLIAAPPALRLAPLLGIVKRVALQRCREHMALVHDVHWAAACMGGNAEDDSPSCTPPDQRVAP